MRTNSFSFLVFLTLILAACTGSLEDPEIAKKICAATDSCNGGGSDSSNGADHGDNDAGSDNGPDITADADGPDNADTSPDLKQADEESDGPDTAEVDGGGELPPEDTADATDAEETDVAPDGDSEQQDMEDTDDAEDTLDVDDGDIATDEGDADATVLPDTLTVTEPDTDASTVDGDDMDDETSESDQTNTELPPPDADAEGEEIDIGPDGSDTKDAGEDADVLAPLCVSNQACEDGNICTDNTCDPVKGCVSAPNTATCTDNNICTEGDSCKDKTCVGKIMICDDGNTCTTDACDKTGGCTSSPNTAVCDDGNACTDSKCGDGSCKSNPPKTCDDKSACTTDSCDPKTGACVFAPIIGCKEVIKVIDFTCNDNSEWKFYNWETKTGVVWNVDNIPAGVKPPSGQCTLNFNSNTTGNYCGLPECGDSIGNVSGGNATYIVPIDTAGYTSVKVEYQSFLAANPKQFTTPTDSGDAGWFVLSKDSNFDGCYGYQSYACSGVNKDCQTLNTTSFPVSLETQPLFQWTKVEYDVSKFAGSKLWLRLRFSACNGVENKFDGWFVDDIKIWGIK